MSNLFKLKGVTYGHFSVVEVGLEVPVSGFKVLAHEKFKVNDAKFEKISFGLQGTIEKFEFTVVVSPDITTFADFTFDFYGSYKHSKDYTLGLNVTNIPKEDSSFELFSTYKDLILKPSISYKPSEQTPISGSFSLKFNF